MTARLLGVMGALLAVGCAGTTPTPIVIYVTPSPGPTAAPSAAPTAPPTSTPSPGPTRTQAPTATVGGVQLTGTLVFNGEFADTIAFNPDGTCAGKAAWSSIAEGARLTFTDPSTGGLLGQAQLTNAVSVAAFSQCTFDWAVTVARRVPKYHITLGSVYWETGSPDRLNVDASVIADVPTPGPDDFAEDVAYWQEYLADEVRDSIGIHIKGVEETDVTLERMFAWVESDYSTEGVMKDIMYDLYDDLAGSIYSDWEPDIVIRMGSSYTNGWLESTTNAGAWGDIEDQLQWERLTTFEKHGSL